jgi:hypothetical protein
MPGRLSVNYKFMNKLLTGVPTQASALASELAAVENISYGLYRTKIWRQSNRVLWHGMMGEKPYPADKKKTADAF